VDYQFRAALCTKKKHRGLRRPRDAGLAKTRPQHVITPVTLDVVRLGAWRLGTPPAKNALFAFRHSAGAVAKGNLSAAFAMHIRVTAVRLGERCGQAADAFSDGRDRHGGIPEQQRTLL
jgi:hypothetical protein